MDVTRKKGAIISKKDVINALKLDTYVAVVPAVKVTNLVLCREIDTRNRPPPSYRSVEMQEQLEDEMEDLRDVQEDSVVEVVADTVNTK